MIINGISESFKDEISLDRCDEICKYWFEFLDKLYFCNEELIIRLSKLDKKIINTCTDCYDKLRVISFKSNVVVEY